MVCLAMCGNPTVSRHLKVVGGKDNNRAGVRVVSIARISGADMDCPKPDYSRVTCAEMQARGECRFQSVRACVEYHLGSLRGNFK